MIKVSVVMPVYNAERTVAMAIESILNQTEQEWELIIVNDGSTDKTEEVIKKFTDERIRYFKINHEGIVSARNHGVNQANSDWICVQDADDLSLPDRLEKCLMHRAGADVIYHGLYINMWNAQYSCVSRKYVPAPNFDENRIKKEQYISGVPFFRKDLWKEKPFRMETQYVYDYAMHVDWVLSGAVYVKVDEGLYEYVRQENSASIRFEKEGKRAESLEALKNIVFKEYDVIITAK